MAARKTPQPLRTGGYACGPQRLELRLTLDQLAEMSGVPAPTLSRIENGRQVMLGAEFSAIYAALRRAETTTNAAAS